MCKMKGKKLIIPDLSDLDNAQRVQIRLELLKKGDNMLVIFEEMLSREKIKKHSQWRETGKLA